MGGFGDFGPINWNGVFLKRNVFDLCVKSLKYMRTDNMSLESTVHWLSEDIGKFEVSDGVYEKIEKFVKNITMVSASYLHKQQTIAANGHIDFYVRSLYTNQNYCQKIVACTLIVGVHKIIPSIGFLCSARNTQ